MQLLRFFIVENIILSRMRTLFILVLALLPASLLASGVAGLPNDLLDELENVPMQNSLADNAVSTNWLASIKIALPPKYWTNSDLTFQEATNLVCEQSQEGNPAAEDLWALALLNRKSPEDSQKGLNKAFYWYYCSAKLGDPWPVSRWPHVTCTVGAPKQT